MKQLFKISVLLVSVFLLSCSDNEDFWIKPELPQDVTMFDMWASEVPLKVQSNGEWKIETMGDWFYVFPTTGSGNATVQICVLENDKNERQKGIINLISTSYPSAKKTIEIQTEAV